MSGELRLLNVLGFGRFPVLSVVAYRRLYCPVMPYHDDVGSCMSCLQSLVLSCFVLSSFCAYYVVSVCVSFLVLCALWDNHSKDRLV